eukprot:gb/GECH01000871.1/.p1 GENE.gb/GECH01000871.1/~~gb/GECH01000871.1/.p1  ORF type:complete len:1520 (+),score=271.53 gb/GECH01000871.1/:1-4560(+)
MAQVEKTDFTQDRKNVFDEEEEAFQDDVEKPKHIPTLLINFAYAIRINKPVPPKLCFLIHMILAVYSVSIIYSPVVPFGYLSDYFLQYLLILRTFGLEYASYTVHRAVASIAGAIILIGLSFMVASLYSFTISSERIQKWKKVVEATSAITCSTSVIFLPVVARMLLVHDENGELVLEEFRDVSFWSNSGQRFFVILSCLVALLSILNGSLMPLIFCDTVPSSPAKFSFRDPSLMMLYISSNHAMLFMAYITPSSYMYIFAIAYTAVSFSLFAFIIYYNPCFLVKSNGFYSGLFLGRSAVGSIVIGVCLSDDDWTKLGLGLSSLPIGIIIGYIGFLLSHNRTQYLLNLARTRYNESQLQGGNSVISEQSLAEQSLKGFRTHQLGLIMRMLIRTGSEKDHRVMQWFYRMLFLSGRTDLESQLAMVTYVVHWRSLSQMRGSKELLRSLDSITPWWAFRRKLEIYLRLRDIDKRFGGRTDYHEMRMLTLLCEKRIKELRQRHSEFWKATISSGPDREIKELESLTSDMYVRTRDLDKLSHNLFERFPQNVSLLRLRAMVIEEFLFDRERADELFIEAEELEETRPSDHTSEMIHIRKQRKSTIPSLNPINQSSRNEMLSRGGFDSQVQENLPTKGKQDYYRKLILTKDNMTLLKISVSMFFFGMVIIIGASSGLSLALLSSNSDLSSLNAFCAAGGLGYNALTLERAQGNFIPNNNVSENIHQLLELGRINFLLQEMSQISDQAYEEELSYGDSMHNLLVPLRAHLESLFLTNDTFLSRNTSFSYYDSGIFFYNSLGKILGDRTWEKEIDSPGADYLFNALKNEEQFGRSLLKLCGADHDNHTDRFFDARIAISAVCACFLFLLVVFLALFCFIFRWNRFKKKRILSLLQNLPVNMKRNIEHSVSRELSEHSDSAPPQNVSYVFKISALFMLLVFVSICAIAVIITFAFVTFDTDERISNITLRLGHANFHASRLYYLAMEHLYQNNPFADRFQLREEASGEQTELQNSWNLALWGGDGHEGLWGTSDDINVVLIEDICSSDEDAADELNLLKCSSIVDLVSNLKIEAKRVISGDISNGDNLLVAAETLLNGFWILREELHRNISETMEETRNVVIVVTCLSPILLALIFFMLRKQLNSFIGDTFHAQSLMNMLPSSFIEFSRDVKKLLPTNDDIRDSSNTQSILSAARDGVAILSEKGTVEEANAAFRKMLRRSWTEIIGKPLKELFVGEEEIEESLNALLKGTTDSVVKEINVKQQGDVDSFPAKVSLSLSKSHDITTLTMFMRDLTDEREQEQVLESEKRKNEQILDNILPRPIAVRLNAGEKDIADEHSDVTCIFATIEKFSDIEMNEASNNVMYIISSLVNRFDELTDQYDIEKIKTIGETYFAVGGLPEPLDRHPEKVLRLARAMLKSVEEFNQDSGRNISIRIGVSTGPVVAGVLGKVKLVYDLWGDTVNTASRMMSTGIPGQIQCSELTAERAKESFTFEARNNVVVKGKGTMNTFLLTGEREETELDVENVSM